MSHKKSKSPQRPQPSSQGAPPDLASFFKGLQDQLIPMVTDIKKQIDILNGKVVNLSSEQQRLIERVAQNEIDRQVARVEQEGRPRDLRSVEESVDRAADELARIAREEMAKSPMITMDWPSWAPPTVTLNGTKIGPFEGGDEVTVPAWAKDILKDIKTNMDSARVFREKMRKIPLIAEMGGG